MLIAGLLVLLLGLSLGAGYQVLARRARPAQSYRGPSPLLGLAVWIVAVQLGGLLLLISGLAEAVEALSFLAVGTLQTILYVGVVWLFVVRSGALGWRDMLGGSAHGGRRRALLDALVGAGVMVPAAFGALLLAILVALLLDTQAPAVVPVPQTSSDVLLVALGAVLVFPIGEEIFFRGYSLTAWARDIGPRPALVRSALFFAAVHIANVRSDTFEGGLRQALLLLAVIIPVGAVLGWLMVRRGLVAAVAGHITYNGILILLLVLGLTLARSPSG